MLIREHTVAISQNQFEKSTDEKFRTGLRSSEVKLGSTMLETSEMESPAMISLDICDANAWSSCAPSPVRNSTNIWICASEGDGEPTSSPDTTAIHSCWEFDTFSSVSQSRDTQP